MFTKVRPNVARKMYNPEALCPKHKASAKNSSAQIVTLILIDTIVKTHNFFPLSGAGHYMATAYPSRHPGVWSSSALCFPPL